MEKDKAPLWCADDSPHPAHTELNEFGGYNYCSGRPTPTVAEGTTDEREALISLMDLIDEHRNGWVRKGSGSSADLADAILARFQPVPRGGADKLRQEFEYRIRTAVTYGIGRGKWGDMTSQQMADWIQGEIAAAMSSQAVRRGAPAEPAVTPQITEADIQAQAAALAAEIHEAWEFQYDECDHGKYSGGHLHGEPYAMCELSAARIIRRRAYVLETALTEGEKP